MANPSGNYRKQAGHAVSSSFNAPMKANSSTGCSGGSGMKHNPGISPDWSSEEQAILENLLDHFASDSMVTRYAKISMRLNDKTVRDVALRCRWMNRKELSKRRKEEPTKGKDKKERTGTSSAAASHFMESPNLPSLGPPNPSLPPLGAPTIPMSNEGGSSSIEIGGVAGELLEQNEQAFNQIKANFSTLKGAGRNRRGSRDRNALVNQNTALLAQARDNLRMLMKEVDKNEPDLMKKMPRLKLTIDDELANAILPPPKVPTPKNPKKKK